MNKLYLEKSYIHKYVKKYTNTHTLLIFLKSMNNPLWRLMSLISSKLNFSKFPNYIYRIAHLSDIAYLNWQFFHINVLKYLSQEYSFYLNRFLIFFFFIVFFLRLFILIGFSLLFFLFFLTTLGVKSQKDS